MPAPLPHLDLTLQGLVNQVHALMTDRADCPPEKDIQEVCKVLYSSSFLKEEGRAVRARVLLAPPDAFTSAQGPPEGIHAIHFSTPHPLTANEIKRLSPAASFFHSVVAIWPDRDRGFRIWGVLNTGPRWQNLAAGGRKPMSTDTPYPIIHVRDPGWLLFYHGYTLLAEWRGTEFHGPRIDVFQSTLLKQRFAKQRRKWISELGVDCLPDTMEEDAYAELSRQISLQFVKRVINLVRGSGHGGSLVVLPAEEAGVDIATRWIDCKYTAEPDASDLRFRHLVQSMIRRVGQLAAPGTSADDAWHLFRTSRDPELDRLEEAFYELARFFSDLMQVDGALVLDQRLRVVGFGGEIRVDRNVLQVGQAHDLDGLHISSWNVQGDGTRHRSVYRLCSVEPAVLGFVISQDSQVRMIANVDDSVVFWSHTVI